MKYLIKFKYVFYRRSAAGMTNTRSAHSLAKVSNIKNTEDFVYESRVGFFDGREVV